MKRHISILGTRGIPASHGGFETFAEQLSLFLVQKDWDVTVYCQEKEGEEISSSEWRGVRRIHIPVSGDNAFSTIKFDFKACVHSLKNRGLFLTLGYNTAIFHILHRFWGKKNIINMDGIEWKRQKWGLSAKLWFWINEIYGCLLGNHLVADHPKIKEHLCRLFVSPQKVTTIAYGSPAVKSAREQYLLDLDLQPKKFALVIARAEPENSILEIVQAFTKRDLSDEKLVVLGKLNSENPYHRKILKAASKQTVFPGAIYDQETVNALRYFSSFYIHGHQVGGTNPSLVEALGAGCAILAHDNEFNVWVASNSALYFKDSDSCAEAMDKLFSNLELRKQLSETARNRHSSAFTWPQILEQYESLFIEHYPE